MDRRYADERAFILRSSVNRIIVRDLLPKRRLANQLTAANCISLPPNCLSSTVAFMRKSCSFVVDFIFCGIYRCSVQFGQVRSKTAGSHLLEEVGFRPRRTFLWRWRASADVAEERLFYAARQHADTDSCPFLTCTALVDVA